MTMTATDAILIAAISFFAALAQGATGFGFAVIALPLLLGVMGSLTAVGLTIILNLLVSLVLAPGLWRRAEKGPLARLSMGSIVGFPVGLVIFLNASLDWVRLAVGLIILFFAAWLTIGQRRATATTTARSAWAGQASRGWAEAAVGVISGTMSTALAMPGPSVMLYLSAGGMTKTSLRATTLCLFTLSYAAALVLQVAVDAITVALWQIAALAAIPTVVGAVAGHRLSRRLGEGLFRKIILAILLATGLYTTASAAWLWL